LDEMWKERQRSTPGAMTPGAFSMVSTKSKKNNSR